MPTEDDVRIAFRDLERHTPDAADVPRAVYQQPRRSARSWHLPSGPPRRHARHARRAGLALAGAGAVAAAVVIAAAAHGPAAKVKPVAAATLRTHLLAAIDTASGDILYAAGGPARGGGRGSGPRIPSPASGRISTSSASGRAGQCSRTGSIPSRCPR